MASDFKIVASLDIPETANEINKDIPKLQGQLKRLQIAAGLDPVSTKKIQATLNKISGNTNINVKFDTDSFNGTRNIKENINAINKEINSYVSKLKALQKSNIFAKSSSNLGVDQTKQEITQLITEYQNLLAQLKGNITPTGLENIRDSVVDLNLRFTEVYDSAKNFESELKNSNSSEQLAKRISVLTSQIEAYKTANTKAQKMYGSQFDSMLNELNSGNISDTKLKDIQKQFQILKNEIKITGNTGKTFFEKLKEQAEKFSSWMTLTGVISGMWRNLQKMIINVIELDKSMTNLKKVTDETETSYSRFLKNSIQQAKELKIGVSDLVNQTAEWSKKGYNLSEASTASKASGIYSVVGEVDNTTAVQDLTTVIKSYNMAIEDSIDIVDKFNNISNKYSVNAADIGEMLSNSVSSLSVAGNSLDQAIAMGTTITEVTGDASEAGNTLKVLSMRLRGASTEIENMGESTDGMAESTSKLREKILALTNVNGTGGFDIMADADNFKSTYQIMQGISEVWNDISNVNQAKIACMYRNVHSITYLIAGKA